MNGSYCISAIEIHGEKLSNFYLTNKSVLVNFAKLMINLPKSKKYWRYL